VDHRPALWRVFFSREGQKGKVRLVTRGPFRSKSGIYRFRRYWVPYTILAVLASPDIDAKLEQELLATQGETGTPNYPAVLAWIRLRSP
jgi:hypothetical protein